MAKRKKNQPVSRTDQTNSSSWVDNQRQSRDELSAERKGRLDTLGFDWDPLTTLWDEGFECLQSFVEE
jgi:hypothetical protein